MVGKTKSCVREWPLIGQHFIVFPPNIAIYNLPLTVLLSNHEGDMDNKTWRVLICIPEISKILSEKYNFENG